MSRLLCKASECVVILSAYRLSRDRDQKFFAVSSPSRFASSSAARQISQEPAIAIFDISMNHSKTEQCLVSERLRSFTRRRRALQRPLISIAHRDESTQRCCVIPGYSQSRSKPSNCHLSMKAMTESMNVRRVSRLDTICEYCLPPSPHPPMAIMMLIAGLRRLSAKAALKPPVQLMIDKRRSVEKKKQHEKKQQTKETEMGYYHVVRQGAGSRYKRGEAVPSNLSMLRFPFVP